MALMRRLAEALMTFTQPQQKTAGSQTAWNAIFASGLDTFFPGMAVLTQPYANHPTVHAAVSAISSGIAGLPMEMFPANVDAEERSELSPLKTSAVLDLLTNPGDDLDGSQLVEGTVAYMKLAGEAFWFLDGMAQRTALGPRFPTRIELWDPATVRHIVTNRQITAWEFRDDTYEIKVPATNVIHFKQFNPYHRYRGLATLTAAMIAARGGYKALQFQEAFFDNGANLQGLLTPKPGQIVHPDALERLRTQFEERHSGSALKGRKLATLDASVDFLPLGMSQKDMDFPLWLDAASAFILMVFKVPPSVAGIQKDANYNESVHQSKRFWYNHMPLAMYLQRRITQKLCKAFSIPEEMYFKTEMIKALTEDQESLSNQARNYFNMGVPFEEINERLELGFDTSGHVSAETSWLPTSLRSADMLATEPIAAALPAGPSMPPQPGDESTVVNDPTQGKAHQKSSEFARAMNWVTLIARVREEERAYEQRIRDHFSMLQRIVLAKLQKPAKDIEPIDINVADLLWDDKKAAKDIQDRTDPLYKSAMLKGYESVAQELSLDISFDFLSPAVQSFLEEKHFEIADLVDGPARDRLRASLMDGLQAGESVETIADRVMAVFTDEKSRARRIARTEIAESFNGGRYETMKEADVQRIEWLTARDDRVRDSHAEIDGEIIALGDRFSNGLQYPLDPNGPAEEIVNCRCVSLPAA